MPFLDRPAAVASPATRGGAASGRTGRLSPRSGVDPKSYRKGSTQVPVLKGVSLGVRRGESLAIVGQSGSGKSTLLHVLATLDAPDEGEVHFAGHRIDRLPAGQRDRLRNRHFGMIFQFYHLLPELTTLENVSAPLMIAEGLWSFWRRRAIHRRAALKLIELVGLSHRLKHRPRELSGGEMQRAAIARALVAGPELLLADEPTGNLDQATGGEILELLRLLEPPPKPDYSHGNARSADCPTGQPRGPARGRAGRGSKELRETAWPEVVRVRYRKSSAMSRCPRLATLRAPYRS